MFELSPDGRRLVYIGQVGAVARLFVRSLDSVESQPLAGTDGARYPFWSPDGRYIAFFVDGKLKKMPAAGGPAQTICDAPEPRGGAWVPDDTIVFSPSNRGGLHRVPASGGKSLPVANFALANGDYDRYPTLAGNGQLLYERFSTNPEIAGIYLGKLDGGAPVRLLPDQSQAYYVPEARSSRGWLLFARERVLLAQPFDLRNGRLSGDPVELGGPLSEGGNTSRLAFAASASGALAMWTGLNLKRQLGWGPDRSPPGDSDRAGRPEQRGAFPRWQAGGYTNS